MNKLEDLTFIDMCKYINIVNELCETGVMTFDLEKCRATVQVDALTEYLEKQNLDLLQKLDNINELLIKERDYHIEGSLEYKLIDEIIGKVNKEEGE